MESKKSFGEYIQQKRKAAGLTQKRFAEMLYVTESAVSKWERGQSYPDISLIKAICEVLGISEHELLTASEDITTRKNEKLARRYTKITNAFKLALIIIYGLGLVTCFIVNLAVEQRLSWFFIVLTAIMVAASLTLLPTVLPKHRALITLGASTASLLLLLWVCSIYTAGDWLVVTVVSVVSGLSIVFMPFILRGFHLPQPYNRHKALICMGLDTVLAVLVVVVAVSMYGGGLSTLNVALPITGFWLILPWAMLVIIRYLPVNGPFKAAGCLGVGTLMFYIGNNLMDALIGGGPMQWGYAYDFTNWNTDTLSNNIDAIVLFTLLALTAAFAIAGIVRAVRRRKSKV